MVTGVIPDLKRLTGKCMQCAPRLARRSVPRSRLPAAGPACNGRAPQFFGAAADPRTTRLGITEVAAGGAIAMRSWFETSNCAAVRPM